VFDLTDHGVPEEVHECPIRAQKRISELEAQLKWLRKLCASLPEGVMVCSASYETAKRANQWLQDVREAGRQGGRQGKEE
jgi:hypothetical protein